MVKRFGREILYLSLTISGALIVLLTLTDQTLKWAIWISGISLATHLIGVGIDYREDKKNES
jgi:hypothetical protein